MLKSVLKNSELLKYDIMLSNEKKIISDCEMYIFLNKCNNLISYL